MTHFGWNDRRRYLLHRMLDVLMELRAAGCTTVYLKGVSLPTKNNPSITTFAGTKQG